jgi:transposase InsO family protein
MIFRFIRAEKANHPVRTMCRVLGVSHSGYYAWCSRPPSARSVRDAELRRSIVRIHRTSRGTYGRPRIHAELRFEGVRSSGKRVARLMRQAGVRGIPAGRRRRSLTRRRRGWLPTPTSWAGTSPPPSPIASGWPTSPTFPPEKAGCTWPRSSTAAPGGSWAGRWPTTSGPSSSWMPWRWPPRSDARARGSYTTPTRVRSTSPSRSPGASRRRGSRDRWVGWARRSTTRRRRACFATIKRELVNHHRVPTRAAARGAVFEFIEVFYNRRRLHSSLGHLSPAEWERRFQQGRREATVAYPARVHRSGSRPRRPRCWTPGLSSDCADPAQL